MHFTIREFTLADYDHAIALWSTIDGLFLNESDSRDAIAMYLARNPGFSAVAIDSAGALIGAVLGGHSGRAGFLNHLAVAPAHRGRGIASQLVAHCLTKLAAANIPRCNIFVYNNNDAGNQFWIKIGFHDPTTWKVMQKRV